MPSCRLIPRTFLAGRQSGAERAVVTRRAARKAAPAALSTRTAGGYNGDDREPRPTADPLTAVLPIPLIGCDSDDQERDMPAVDVDHFGSDEDLDEAMTDAFDHQDAVDAAELDRLK